MLAAGPTTKMYLRMSLRRTDKSIGSKKITETEYAPSTRIRQSLEADESMPFLGQLVVNYEEGMVEGLFELGKKYKVTIEEDI